MFELTVSSHFSGAHQLRHLHGKCEALHGHNWKVEISVTSHKLNRGGVVIDFKILKEKLEKVLRTLDHHFLNDLTYFRKKEPSSENIAKYIFEGLKKEFRKSSVLLSKVTVWESEATSATYREKSK